MLFNSCTMRRQATATLNRFFSAFFLLYLDLNLLFFYQDRRESQENLRFYNSVCFSKSEYDDLFLL